MRIVVLLQRKIELDDPADEARREDAHAAVVEEINAFDLPRRALAWCCDRVIPEMRIAVDDPVAKKRAPPRVEEADGDRVAGLLRRLFERRQRLAVEPLQRQKPARRQALFDAGHADEWPVGEHEAIEIGDLRLTLVVELLAHPLADLVRDLARVDRRA